jgi:hypothetical protein
VQLLWKSVWRLLTKLKIDLPYNPAILFLGIYLKNYKSIYKRDTYIHMFIAALFTNCGNNQGTPKLMKG